MRIENGKGPYAKPDVQGNQHCNKYLNGGGEIIPGLQFYQMCNPVGLFRRNLSLPGNTVTPFLIIQFPCSVDYNTERARLFSVTFYHKVKKIQDKRSLNFKILRL